MTHGKRHQRQFRSGSLQRKAKAQDRENKKFDAETERLFEQLKVRIKAIETDYMRQPHPKNNYNKGI